MMNVAPFWSPPAIGEDRPATALTDEPRDASSDERADDIDARPDGIVYDIEDDLLDWWPDLHYVHRRKEPTG